MRQLALLLLSGVLLLGCGGKENMEEILNAGEVTAAPTAVPTAAPSVTYSTLSSGDRGDEVAK